MRLSKIIPLIFLIILIVINRIGAQCDGEVDGIIPIDEFPYEINGNTVGGGDDFIVSDLVGSGFSTEDRIYKLTLGSTDTLSLYVDMCRDGVTFDASIAIIKADIYQQLPDVKIADISNEISKFDDESNE